MNHAEWECLHCARKTNLLTDDYCPTCGEPLPDAPIDKMNDPLACSSGGLLIPWTETVIQAVEREHPEIAGLLRRLVARVQKLESQLPKEMPDCTIEYKQCELGHGWLAATNWIQHGCPTCRVRELENATRTAAEIAKEMVLEKLYDSPTGGCYACGYATHRESCSAIAEIKAIDNCFAVLTKLTAEEYPG